MFTRSRIVLIALLWATIVFGTQFGDIPVTQVIGTPTITNDANVTLTLGGTPTDALLKPFSLTLGWTGTLSITRGGTGASTASGALSNLGGEPALGNPSVSGYVLSSTTGGVRSWVAQPTFTAPVTSVFTRTGAVVAQSGDYTFSQIGSKPTTLAGYGITDAEPYLGLPGTSGFVLSSTTGGTRSWIALPSAPVSSVFGRTGAVTAQSNDYTFAQIGSTPTTLAGYGITDPVVLTSGSYSNPSWITALAWSKITGAPSFESPLTFQQSLSRSSNTVNLVNDSASPGNSMLYGTDSSGTKGWYTQPSGGGGGVTNIATTSPITGGPITTTGTIGLNVGVDHAFTVAQSVKVTDALTTSSADVLTLGHNSTNPAGIGFGEQILFNLKTSTTNDRSAARIGPVWSTATEGSQTSSFLVTLSNGAVFPSVVARFSGVGGLTVGPGTSTDTAAGVINAATGFRIANVGNNGFFLQGNGTNYQGSSYTLPTTAGAGGTVWTSNGTNMAVSTYTIATPGASGNIMTSNGTNWTSTAPTAVPGAWDNILKVSGSDYTTTSTSAASITGLITPTLSFSTLYEFEITLAVASTDTNGLKVAVTGSGAAYTRLVYTGLGTTSGTITQTVGGVTGDSLSTAVCTVAGDGFVHLHGFMLTAASGSPNIIARIAKVTSGTATVYIGSQLKYRKV